MTDKRKKEYNVVDREGEVTANLIEKLFTKGSARLVNFGSFHITEVKGRKRFDFKNRSIVKSETFKRIVFKPSRALREMLKK